MCVDVKCATICCFITITEAGGSFHQKGPKSMMFMTVSLLLHATIPRKNIPSMPETQEKQGPY